MPVSQNCSPKRITSVQPDELAIASCTARPRTGEWFDALFRDQYPRMVSMLARLTGDRAQAEEIAADTFSKLARRPAVLGAREDIAAWVYRVAFNAGLDAVRANARRRRREEAAAREHLRDAHDSGALDSLLRDERGAKVRAILASMKPRDAQILLLRSGGMAYREIAQALGVAASSVGTLLARAETEFECRFRARYGDDV
jgi:RNA polymerase sigma-70 factor (ECF subfamily)